MSALIDGRLAPGSTDHFYIVRPEQLNRKVRGYL